VTYEAAIERSPSPGNSSDTPATPGDDPSDTEEMVQPEMRTRISYEEAIAANAHEGESLIARELREAREREEELRRQREQLMVNVNTRPADSAGSSPRPQGSPAAPVTQAARKEQSTYQQDVSPFKNDRRQSTDSLSSGHSNDKLATTPKANVKSAFGGGGFGKIGGLNYSVPEKTNEPKQRQETPIEREIRLARERENEYKISKGLPPLKDEKKVVLELDDDEKDMIVSRPYFPGQKTTGSSEKIQRFASNRLQKEINKQAEIEKKYLDEGKIKSTSEEHVGLIKYTEIKQDNTTPGRRNFSIAKKTPEVNNESKQNGSHDAKSSPKVALTPEQNMPKYNRSASSSGGVTFSYRESRHKAESKIEQELREMREREEELR